MDYKDYYKVLGLERAATQPEVKQTYRKLARKFHPDINKASGAEAQFKEVGEAYEVLGDTGKRAAYDQLGNDLKAGQEFRPPPDWNAGFEFSGAPSDGTARDRSDFFEALFAGMHQQEHPSRARGEFHARGEDHHAKIYIDLLDTFGGANRAISLRVPQIDETGHVVLKDRTLNVTIPAGVTESQNIRLKGQGAPGVGRMPAGDLYLEIQFKPNALYRVAGRDLYLDLPVTPWEAALGGNVKMPTPAGAINLKIPPGSSQGQQLRLKGRGIPASEPGDLFAVLEIVLPPAGTEQAKKIYEDMARELAFDPRANFGAELS
jgi:curved DNA-binding protein